MPLNIVITQGCPNISKRKSKGKVHTLTGHEGPEGGVEVWIYSIFNLGARWEVDGRGQAPAALLPRKNRYPLYRRLGGPQWPVWTGAENLFPTGIRYPDRSGRSESLYRLPAPPPPILLFTEIQPREFLTTFSRLCSGNKPL